MTKIVMLALAGFVLVGCGDSARNGDSQRGDSQRGEPPPDSAFRQAVRDGNAAQVSWYLEDGYDVNRLGFGGENALHEGILHFDVAKLLLEQGVEVNQQHKYDGTTPLIVACIAGNVEARTVKLLLDEGADPRITDMRGKTALEYAAEYSGMYSNDRYGFDEKVEAITVSLRQIEQAEQAAGGDPVKLPN